jgi:hypothetical protein
LQTSEINVYNFIRAVFKFSRVQITKMLTSVWVAAAAVGIMGAVVLIDGRPIAPAPAAPWWYKPTQGNVLGPEDWHQVRTMHQF